MCLRFKKRGRGRAGRYSEIVENLKRFGDSQTCVYYGSVLVWGLNFAQIRVWFNMILCL